jgi:hypothetical protein
MSWRISHYNYQCIGSLVGSFCLSCRTVLINIILVLLSLLFFFNLGSLSAVYNYFQCKGNFVFQVASPVVERVWNRTCDTFMQSTVNLKALLGVLEPNYPTSCFTVNSLIKHLPDMRLEFHLQCFMSRLKQLIFFSRVGNTDWWKNNKCVK